MSTWHETEQGWWAASVPLAAITQAKAEREARDATGTPTSGGHNADTRWTGHLGEMALVSWLRHLSIKHEHDGGINGRPDFAVGKLALGHKNRNFTGGPVNPNLCVSIPNDHLAKLVDLYVWTCYEVKTQRIVVVGGLSRDEFLKVGHPPVSGATYPCLDIEIGKLYPARTLARALRRTAMA